MSHRFRPAQTSRACARRMSACEPAARTPPLTADANLEVRSVAFCDCATASAVALVFFPAGTNVPDLTRSANVIFGEDRPDFGAGDLALAATSTAVFFEGGAATGSAGVDSIMTGSCGIAHRLHWRDIDRCHGCRRMRLDRRFYRRSSHRRNMNIQGSECFVHDNVHRRFQ